jgi:hypothetical protein
MGTYTAACCCHFLGSKVECSTKTTAGTEKVPGLASRGCANKFQNLNATSYKAVEVGHTVPSAHVMRRGTMSKILATLSDIFSNVDVDDDYQGSVFNEKKAAKGRVRLPIYTPAGVLAKEPVDVIFLKSESQEAE